MTFRNPCFLRQHIGAILSFYYPTCIDTRYGGYVAQIDERDGHVYDPRTKHLVATARAIHSFSVGVLLDGPVWCRTAAEWGLGSLSTHFWDDTMEGYDWLLEGRETVDAAVDLRWDEEHGGFYYTTDADGDPVVEDKYSWAHAEGIGAAALLSTHDDTYLEWYDRLWAHADEHFVNPRHGNWYERLTREHERDGPNRGVAVEPDYHPLNNARVAMEALDEDA